MDMTCPFCGATRRIDLSQRLRRFVCDYCDSVEVVEDFESRDSYIDRARVTLKNKEFKSAIAYCEEILFKGPEDWEAHWIKVMAKCEVCDEADFARYGKAPLNTIPELDLAKKYAPNDKLLIIEACELKVYRNILREYENKHSGIDAEKQKADAEYKNTAEAIQQSLSRAAQYVPYASEENIMEQVSNLKKRLASKKDLTAADLVKISIVCIVIFILWSVASVKAGAFREAEGIGAWLLVAGPSALVLCWFLFVSPKLQAERRAKIQDIENILATYNNAQRKISWAKSESEKYNAEWSASAERIAAIKVEVDRLEARQ